MRNLLTAFILILSTATGLAQNTVKGVIKDIYTSENIGLVTVSTQDLQHNTISNSDGVFKLEYPEGTKSIVLNYLGYAILEVNLSGLPADGIYYLEPKSYELEEIVMTNVPINEFVDKLRKNSFEKLNAPFLLNTYYREFVKINDRYTKFSDALIDYNVIKKKDEVKSEVVVKQSRAVKLDVENEEEIDMTSPLDLRKATTRDCNFSVLEHVFGKKEYKKYSFIIKSQGNKNGQTTQTIFIEPLESIEEPLYAGTLSFDPDKNLILSIDIHMAESHKKHSKLRNFLIVKARLDDISYKSFYKITGDNYMLSYSCTGGDVYLKNKKKYDDHIIFKSDLLVTNFSNDLTSFDKKEKYKEKGLYQRGNKYTDEFWLKNNSIQLTAQEEEIIKSLTAAKP